MGVGVGREWWAWLNTSPIAGPASWNSIHVAASWNGLSQKARHIPLSSYPAQKDTQLSIRSKDVVNLDWEGSGAPGWGRDDWLSSKPTSLSSWAHSWTASPASLEVSRGRAPSSRPTDTVTYATSKTDPQNSLPSAFPGLQAGWWCPG